MRDNTFLCLHCHKDPEHEDVFICKVTDSGIIEASVCLNCADDGDTRKKPYGGWITVKKIYTEYWSYNGEEFSIPIEKL